MSNRADPPSPPARRAEYRCNAGLPARETAPTAPTGCRAPREERPARAERNVAWARRDKPARGWQRLRWHGLRRAPPAPATRAGLKDRRSIGAPAAAMRIAVLLAWGLLAGTLPGWAPPARALEAAGPDWPDSRAARLQALALLQGLNAELLANASATLTLDRWCGAHRLAPEGTKIVADRLPDAGDAPGTEIRDLLKVGPDAAVNHRRVQLRCGTLVLSEADNWYLPDRLTPEMNRTLESTDTAFGRVVAPLDFRRRTLSAQLLWRPLPEGWEMAPPTEPESAGALAVPALVLEHRAVLTTPDGTPFSTLVERYTRAVLAFPWMGAR